MEIDEEKCENDWLMFSFFDDVEKIIRFPRVTLISLSVLLFPAFIDVYINEVEKCKK